MTGVLKKMTWRFWAGCGLLILTVCLAVMHCASGINLLTADLGRHLKNGELVLQGSIDLTRNFYSYTYPDFISICHHWLSGVLFYAIWDCAGFEGLSFFYIALLVTTVLIFMRAAVRSSQFSYALLAVLLTLPLVGYRTEIRPEGISTFFLAVFFLILYEYRAGRLRAWWLWVLPFCQIIWVNAHIFFFLGIFICGVFAVDAFWREGRTVRFWAVLKTGLGVVAASLVNPFGMQGFLEPFSIFKEYGYELAENQNILFMLKRFPGEPVYPYFLILWFVLTALLIWQWCVTRDRKRMILVSVLFVLFSLMAMKTVRAIAMFGFFFIPFASGAMAEIAAASGSRAGVAIRTAAGWAGAALIVVSLVSPAFFFSPLHRFRSVSSEVKYKESFFHVLARPSAWSGLLPGVQGSADFWRASGMKGRVCNNYDIGGYLIFHLYPSEEVFVDNRPESYPADFFRKVYVPMQEDDRVWEQVASQYGFEAIYFFRRDMTPWAQPFLIRRLRDKNWAPVFADGYTIILAKRGGINQAVIDRYELPPQMFKISGN